ncbi:MAG: hypothetical protein ACM4AI_27655 [Acidobacteriota bacterium]
MESLLVVVAGVSLVLAAIMTAVAWRLIRDKGLRTSSRAEALMALVRQAEGDRPSHAVATRADLDDVPETESRPQPQDEPRPQPQHEPRPQVQPDQRPQPFFETRPMQGHLRFAAAASSWDETDVRRTGPAIDDAMFVSSEPRQMPLGRWLALAAAGLVILAGAGTVYAVNTGHWPPTFAIAGDREEMVAASARQPLELLSLRHSTDEAGAFVVTGLVQNPDEGTTLRDVVATVFLFDSQGRYLASGRAKLEISPLNAGEESPFIVKIPKTATVSRYRVGFRLDNGGVVAHVDRRGQPPSGTSGDTIDGDPGPAMVAPAATPRRSEG